MITRFEVKENEIFVNVQIDVQENYCEWLRGETATKVMQDFNERKITEKEYIELSDTELTIWLESALIKAEEIATAEIIDETVEKIPTIEERMVVQESTTTQIIGILEGLV